MFRLFPVLALGAAFAFPASAQVCECEIAWEQTVTATWQGQTLDQERIDGLVCPNLRYLRNVSYARHGYTFTQPWIAQQFAGDPRYIVDEYITDHTVEGVMTPNDRHNVALIVAQEGTMDCTNWWDEHSEQVKSWIVAPAWQREPSDVPAWQQPEGPDIPAWQQPEGPDIPAWQQPEGPVVHEEEIVDVVPLPGYVVIQEMYVGPDGITYLTIGEANPTLLVDLALDGRVIENEWLAPLSCEELEHVEDALYARYQVDFPDPADKAYFAAATIGIYTPEPMRTRYMAEVLHFESVDKLTLLRVDRTQRNKQCQEDG